MALHIIQARLKPPHQSKGCRQPFRVTQSRASWRDAVMNGYWKKILLFYKVHKIQSPHHGMESEFDISQGNQMLRKDKLKGYFIGPLSCQGTEAYESKFYSPGSWKKRKHHGILSIAFYSPPTNSNNDSSRTKNNYLPSSQVIFSQGNQNQLQGEVMQAYPTNFIWYPAQNMKGKISLSLYKLGEDMKNCFSN